MVLAVLIVSLGLWGREYRGADAIIQGVYTLPFFASISFECHFTDCYPGHQGVDYQLGDPGTPGEHIVAALEPRSNTSSGLVKAAIYRTALVTTLSWITKTATRRGTFIYRDMQLPMARPYR